MKNIKDKIAAKKNNFGMNFKLIFLLRAFIITEKETHSFLSSLRFLHALSMWNCKERKLKSKKNTKVVFDLSFVFCTNVIQSQFSFSFV